MSKMSLLLIAGLAALTAALAQLVPVGEKPAMVSDLGTRWLEQGDRYAVVLPAAVPDPGSEWPEQGGLFTVTLPVIFRSHDSFNMSPFGVTMYGGIDDASGLQTMKNAGVRWATTTLNWATIQPNRADPLNWSSFDTAARNAQAAGMELFVLFTGNPSWAAQYPGGPVYNIQDLVTFVTLMAERYDCDGIGDAAGHPCVRYWSFYAEPDNGNEALAPGGKGLWGHNGAGYAAMLSKISPAIHAANPEAKVLIGGLAYDHFEPAGHFVRSFLTDTLEALNSLNTYPGGAGAYIDAVAFHYYPISPDRWPTIREKGEEIRSIMANHGVGHLPLLSPEMGYWSSHCMGSSTTKQANWLVQNYVKGLSANIKLMSWYKVFDAAVACGPEDQYPDRTNGLLDMNGTPKLSYAAYRTMTRELALARYSRPYQATGAEGYVFTMNTGRPKTVLWSRAGTVRVVFPHTHLRVVTATGVEYDIWDNQRQGTAPGDLDSIPGQIQLELYDNQPFYVEPK